MKVIKGNPCDKWEEVQSLQSAPFIYIMSNGSKFAGQEADDIDTLIAVLGSYKLENWSHWTVNPCRWAYNPDYKPGNGLPQYIDGPRLYAVDGVTRFFGNFEKFSHVFNIDTNDIEIIKMLKEAIETNRKTFNQS